MALSLEMLDGVLESRHDTVNFGQKGFSKKRNSHRKQGAKSITP